MHRRENPRPEFAMKETNKRQKKLRSYTKKLKSKQLTTLEVFLAQIAKFLLFVTEIPLLHCSPSYPMYHTGPAAGRLILLP